MDTMEYCALTRKLLEKRDALTTTKRIRTAEQQMRAEEFRRTLRNFDREQQKLTEDAERRRKIEAKQRQEKRERDRRINEIRALLAHYRRKLAFDKNDPAVLAAISELQNKLFWLMYSI